MTDHLQPKQAEELKRYGIERVPAEAYMWGGYRYSNAHEALAAAKRAVAE